MHTYIGSQIRTFNEMGQNGSTHHGHRGRGRNFRRATLSMLGKKHSQPSKILSHTFAYDDDGLKVDRMNLNTATEEELMTLPGISRAVARNIVCHRQAIGRFHRVEDLVLVSGVGAYKLELVRPEICVASANASTSSSQASISLNSSGNTGSLLDINSASVFALQGIPGLNQELAANVVERRHRRGFYQSLDELAKVRGIGKHRLAIIKPYLKIVVDSDGSVTPTPSNGTSSSLGTNPQMTSTPVSNGVVKISSKVPRVNGINPSAHVTNDIETSSGITEDEIWELLSVASPRPLTPSNYSTKLEGRTSFRIATWNLERFSVDKACNPGVREVICRTILENRLSLLALQEIESSEALAKITLELNSPILKRVRDWQGNRKVWRSIHLGQGLAILWDTDGKIRISLQHQSSAAADSVPAAACATFHINKVTITVVNAALHGVRDRRAIDNYCRFQNTLVLGDFSTMNGVEDLDLELPRNENTAVHPEKLFFNDNIAWSRKSRAVLRTGHSGIVKQGLTHLGIPRGWKWGGAVSTHCPVWCQIYSQLDE
ncbi:endonuclease/exonuclease/phosphatase family domain-containing protein 1-like isoform X2 [Neodiprion fabricii]|uniref:endonuclease/exonuclease/phosphatase family domain-containing protein 1-like isoform X2 n=1 Tax=Neodiprion fabricii TaxID=2872261 RepID=UPI001ED9777D|nr:endonuclease/exonuclease/phosphatase family domain-containing protein 1-like isoform X2 [Neodiprion fabricii]